MTLVPPKPLPPPTAVAIGQVRDNGTVFLSQLWAEYLASEAAIVRALAASNVGPLIAAANDAAAAAAGVPVGGLYRIANAVQVRLV